MILSGREKATIFLSILGSETSSAILRYLPEDLSDVIASSINNLPTPTAEALGVVFSDFKSFVALPQATRHSEESTIFEEEPSFDVSLESDPEKKLIASGSKKIAYLLSQERPQITAFILSFLPPMKREEILMNITSNRDQIDDILVNLKPTSVTNDLKEKLIDHFAGSL